MDSTNNNEDHFKDNVDGNEFEWNETLKEWVPKMPETFINNYVENGECFDSEQPQEGKDSNIQVKKNIKKKRKDTSNTPATKKEAEWFTVDENKDTHVYVSGMPNDVTEDEFIDMMTKYGIIMEDTDTKKLKIKLYRDKNGNIKGDGLVCYLKHESVNLAIDMLDESDMRGNVIYVEPAKFQLKGEYNPKLKPTKKKVGKSKECVQDRLLDWVERDKYKKQPHKRACVIHNLFNPSEFVDDPSALFEYKSELKEECEKFGDVKKVFVFMRSKDGVASVLFKEEESAQKCVQAMDGRLCNGQVLMAHIWDGITKYEEEETEEEKEIRIKKWHDTLE